MPNLDGLEARLRQIEALGWFYILTLRADGSYLVIVTREAGGRWEYHGEADTPAEAAHNALREAMGAGLPT